MDFLTTAQSFHAMADIDPGVGSMLDRAEVLQQKRIIVQDRSVSYRFFLHQHPYVRELTQRLYEGGTRSLLAADTDYTPDGASIAGTVRVALKPDAKVRLARGVTVRLPDTLQVLVGGIPTELVAGLEVTLNADSVMSLPTGMSATLVDGLTPAPKVGAVFPLNAALSAHAYGVSRIKTDVAVLVRTPAGLLPTLPAGTVLYLLDRQPVGLQAGERVTLLRSILKPVLFRDFFPVYAPDESRVARPRPVKDLDFSINGAYSLYNWELFFHVPLTMAIHLSKNGRYADAQRWFHFLFDPTDDSDGPSPARFWKVRPFQTLEIERVESLLVNLATGANEELRQATVQSIEAWKNEPFRPHVIARYRQQAYMYKTVMSYLDNLVAWGDSLFQQDTGEAIDEALQLYVLAANILGPKPQAVPAKGTIRPQTYAQLRPDLHKFGTVLRDIEAELPFDLMPFPSSSTRAGGEMASISSIGQALYFGVPSNPNLLAYWDTVADRLFKIRNSLNFQGIFRQLALFEPPIDPGALARAVAAGLDIGAVVSGVNQPLPTVRFEFLIGKALEMAAEVKGLGAALLAAIEKEDGEAIALLRQKHETALLQAGEHVRYAQLQETKKQTEALNAGLASAVARFVFFERQLGGSADDLRSKIPLLDDLNLESLGKMAFSMVEPSLSQREVEINIASDAAALAFGGTAGGYKVSSHEALAGQLLEAAQIATDVANILGAVGAGVSQVPNFEVHVEPFGAGASVKYGGSNLSNVFSFLSGASNTIASRLNFEAGRASRADTYYRRELEWAYQSNLASLEVNQIIKQLRAAQLREAIAQRELENHQGQIARSREVEAFLNAEGTDKTGKVSNKAFYTWLKRETRGLYSQAFQLAFEIARKAERAFGRELGDATISYLQLNYLAGKEGLLAGERLVLDLKRMELAYHEQNLREYEITKHVSLLQLAPMALVQLRATGRCVLKIPEEVFDMDGPGHYFRRLRGVAVSVPSVVGPYASINCTLTLLKNSIRTSPKVGDQYARIGTDDIRFSDYFGSTQSVVVSGAQADTGEFDQPRRERYSPFEFAGAISEWQLTLPANPAKGEPAHFDYQSIGDVILHLRFTAREGGDVMRRAAMKSFTDAVGNGSSSAATRLLSARHDFPMAWASYKAGAPEGKRPELAIDVTAAHYPYWAQGQLKSVRRIDLLARREAGGDYAVHAGAVDADSERKEALRRGDDQMLAGHFTGGEKGLQLPASPIGVIKLYPQDTTLDDFWIAISWGGAE
ncbi:Tc toxin subunit A-related protein [Rhizobium mongolense]